MILDQIYEDKCTELSDINEHLPVLREYAAKSLTVTEFGVRTGVSTWAFMAGKPAALFSYDLVPPPDEVLRSMIETAGLAGVLFQFTKANVLEIEIGHTTTLFIDTYHTYRQLWQELKLHANKVLKWIILHDTETFGEKGEANEEKGLNYAIGEFLAENEEWSVVKRYTNNNGLTILERK